MQSKVAGGIACAPLRPCGFAASSSGSRVGGRIHPMKDRTDEEGIDPVADAPTDDAGRRGMDESRRGGKHGDPRVRTMIEEILDPENLAEAWTAAAAIAAPPPPRSD